MTKFAAQVVEFLDEDGIGALKVHTLFCEVSIDKALQTMTARERRLSVEMEDPIWFAQRVAESDQRRQALISHLGGALISEKTAEIIDQWAEANPYSRPVDAALISALQEQYDCAQELVLSIYRQQKALHGADRYGWDHSSDAEDLEYSEMLQELDVAAKQKQAIARDLELAIAGFIWSEKK